MPDKAMAYVRMAEDAAKQITGSYERWTAFLNTAARVYKYSYTEQLMIFAQRPDATACAEYGLWTNTMRRYVRRGSKGIALIDTSAETPRIRYVFDVSDTGAREDSVPVNLWKMEPRHMDAVMSVLQTYYGVERPSLLELLESAAYRRAGRYWEENEKDVIDIVDGSFLAEYDRFGLEDAFKKAVSVSVAYAVMSRCGLEPEKRFNREDFKNVFDFNTPEAISLLGTTVSDLSEKILRQVEILVKNEERRRENERIDEPDLSGGRGRAASQRDPGRDGNDAATGEVRQDAETVSQGTAPSGIQSSGVQREAANAPHGDRGDGANPAGTDDGRNEGESGRDRAAQSRESDGMGGPDERPEEPGRGNRDGGVDLQLTSEQPEEPAAQAKEEPIAESAEENESSAFSAVQENMAAMPEQAEPEKAAADTEQAVFDFPEMGTEQTSLFGSVGTEPQPVDIAPVPHGLPYPQEIIDAALTVGANDLSSRKRITAYFMKDKSSMDNTIFLRDQYGTNGAGFYVRDTQYAIWYDASGIRLSMGDSAMGGGAYMITWEQAATRIRELLDEGRYIPQAELNDAADFELRETAEQLIFMYRDIDDEYQGLHFLPTVAEAYSVSNDHTEQTEKMVELLRQPNKLHNLSEEMQAFMTAYAENRAILRFRYHRVRQLVTKLNDLQRKPLTFTAAPDYAPQRRFFISADEMDNLLREHKDNHDYRLGVYSFFLAHTDSKEREQYMKNVHGEYSGSYSGNNNILYTHKSVSFSHGDLGNPYASVEWKWNKVARRIGELIQANRFLTDEDRAAMPEYERNQIARQIVNAMAGAPDYIPRPFTGNPFTDYSENVKQVQAQLTDPVRVQAIHDSLVTLFEMTLPDDRRYNDRSEALDTLKAYQQGEFSLFGEKREPVLVQDNSASEPARKSETAEGSAASEQDTKEPKPRKPSHKTKPAERYSLGFGHMGNGLVVWNRLEEEHGDYKTVAQIQSDRTVKFYDDEMPESVRKIIIEEAETSDARISATQNDPVFSTPPRERTLTHPAQEIQTQPEQPPVNADGQAPGQPSAVSGEHAEALSPQASQAPVSPKRTIVQEDIDEALREWNGSIESKRAVVAYMREHGREREAAAWLRQECGDDMPAFPVHGVIGAEGDISWTRVQRGILRLIQEDRFFTEEEKRENLSLEANRETNSEEKGPEISVPSSDAAETLSPTEFVTPGGIHYHVGDTFQYARPDGSVSSILLESIDENGYLVLFSDRFSDNERIAVLRSGVEENIDNGKYILKGGETAEEAFHTPGGHTYRAGDELDWVVDGDLHISIHIDRVDAENVWCTFPGSEDGEPTRMERNGFEAQIDNGSFTFVVNDQEQAQEKAPTPNPEQQETVPAAEQKDTIPITAEETAILPMSMEAAVEYNDLKARYPDALVGFEQHGYYEFYGEDAKTASLLLNTKTFTKEVPGGHINVTGFPTRQWQHNFRTLWSNGNDVYLASEKPDGTHEETKYLRKEDYIPLNAKLHINGREFRVASVDFQTRKVSLQDMDIQRESNYPLFREVLIAEARNLLENEIDFPVSLDEITPQIPAKEPEPVVETPSENREETGKGEAVPSAQEDIAPLRPGERLIPAHDGIPAMREIVIDLTRRVQETEKEKDASAAQEEPREQKPQTGMPTDSFEYQGYHFEPVGVFPDQMSFQEITGGTVSHTELGMTDALDAKNHYAQVSFYAAAHDVKADVFRCVETQKLYVPGEHELFEYVGAFEPFRVPERPLETARGNAIPSQRVQTQNFRITDNHLGEGGAKTKFKNNMAAIYTLKALETEGRPATHDEQEVLSRYVGWGGLSAAFDPDKKDWSGEYEELKAALTPEEYTAARASTLNAHYTSPTVIRAVYEALGNMGFQKGNILEPAMGVGNFFGMLPESMKESKLYGVELDSITGRIAQKLYPQADITVAGFETTDRRDFFDVAVGNVPFGNYKVNDRAYNKLGFNIHNYFFAKALDQVRPGGIVAFVTSRYTMDAKSPEVRKYLAQRAELLGAVRLPNNAFFANAGTEVTSDIIFLQKRDRPIDIEPDWVHLGMTGDGIPVNSYFADHPEMVLGNIAWDKSMYGDERETTCVPLEGVSLADQLSVAIQRLSGQYQEADLPDLAEGEEITDTIRADPNVANYSYTVVDGKVYYRENSVMVRPKLSQTAQERTAGMVELRDCVRQLMNAQLNNASDQAIHALQEKLNTLYDAYTAKYGLINSRGNAQAFADDSSYYLLCSLEVLDENGNLERKADMFSKRTIRQQQVVDHVDTAVEALAVSIAERAAVDLPFMAELTGKSEEEITGDLQGVIFRLPEPAGKDGRSRYVTADEYLSGNVRHKLRVAQSWAESDDSFNVNVKALEQVQPEDLSASEIDVRLGATWVDPHYIQQFMYETFHTPLFNQRTPDHYVRERYAVTVNFSRNTAEWTITNKRAIPDVDVAAYSTFGTSRAGAYDLLEAALNLRDVKIYDKKYDPDGKEVRVLNPKETTLAQQKQQAIKDAFREWVWKDPERREELVRVYNERFNSTRPREYDGSHISFVGMNPEINLRPHQRNAIAHVLYGGNTLLAHQVGAGKTFEMAASAMESKRLGLCSKSLFVVPNHLTEQWASEFLRLYPSAKILVAKKKDFEKKNRKKFCARIATGEYDAVIIGHSQFEKIPISFMRQERLLEEQIREIMAAIAEVKYERGERFTVKQMERSRKQLEARLEKLRAEHKKDDVVTFEELGVDRLYVDEAHFYKNLFTFTKMSNVAGLSTAEAQKSSDMFLKCRYMDEITGGRGIIFATGTPVSNSMVELYTMQRYLQFDALKEKGMNHFDCWASTFGETVTALELAPEGTGYRARTRFAKFFNLPELMNMFKEVADIKTADLLNLPTPEAHYETTAVQPSEIQERLVKSLSERAAAVHAHIVDPSDDNMLKITSDGRKLGLDQRLIDPMLPDHPGSKVNVCVDNIFRIWQEGKADKLTQLVFCDLSTPRSSASSRAVPVTETEGKETEAEKGDTPEAEESAAPVDEQKTEDIPEPIVQNIDQFSVYDDIRSKLIAKGIPPEEIAFIHDANTEVRKKELFAKVRSGQVRVLMGSTSKMGAGTNCQDRLIALHDLDAPWRPGDLEQRAGRIVRQGNTNKDVYIYRYVTEKSFDAYLWQTLENKQKFISQIMTSKSPVRSCEDVDETALSYAEIKALCAGDPRIKEKMDLDIEVARLRLMKADHDSKKYALEDQIRKEFPKKISQCQQTIEGLRHDLEQLAAHPVPEKEFAGMTVDGTFYSEKSKAGTAIIEFCKKHYTTDRMEIGEYRGFPMTLQYDPFNKRFELTMHGEMAHRTELGSDVYGNIQRIDNALASIGQRIDGVKANLENYQNQMKAAEEEVQKPFPQEEELREKSAKLAELDAELNIDGQPRPQEQTEIQEVPEREIAKQARPSILERLQQPCACPAAKRNNPAKVVR